jgi:hypothetical protein
MKASIFFTAVLALVIGSSAVDADAQRAAQVERDSDRAMQETLSIALPIVRRPQAPLVSTGIVISQVYGGGGNSGATFKNDFIELFNRGDTSVNISGWSVQYTSATGTTWQTTNLVGVSIQPGQYYLVQEAVGAGGTTNLPTPDATGTIAMSATAGKVALVNSTTGLTGACPTGANIIDLVGYGTTANCFEGSGPAPAPSNTNADLRASSGCVDTDSNQSDFATGAPNPRNTGTVAPCPGGSTPTPTPTGTPTPTATATASPTTTPTATPTATPTPALTIGDVSHAEGNSGTTSYTFTISLSQPAAAGGVTFDVDTADNTATAADNDYVPLHSVGVSIPESASSTTVTVLVNGDTAIEPTETFRVNISNVTGAGVADGQGTGTIINDDGVGTSAIVISQVYGGGGNSGSTYKNDFVELYNRGSTPVDVTGWSVQFTGPTGAFAAQTTATPPTPLTTNLSGTIQPGHYYLIQESQGAGGTTILPTPDITGGVLVGSTQGKVALVNNTTVLSGNCPNFVTNGIVDFVGYGAADCSETSPTNVLNNTTAAIRKNNGCTDTDNNSFDFDLNGPIPRNSSVGNICAAAGALSGNGSASPNSLDPGGSSLLTVTVTPATGPSSTGITVVGDLGSIGGSATQQFYDDGTHGDVTSGDNIFSFFATVSATTTTGAKQIPFSVADAQARSSSGTITVSVDSPTCGVERWSVKVGTDPDASLVDLTKATPVTLAEMRGWPAPASPPLNARVAPYETTVWVVNGTLIDYKEENDVDYHIVIQDGSGNTIITEIPCPCCAIGSPFQPRMSAARQTFDGRLMATTFFQNPNIPVRITGVGFFDFLHGQTGVAPNGIELHSILDIAFPTQESASTGSGSNVTTQVGDVTFTFANVSSSGSTTVNPIDPSSAGPPLPGYSLVGPAFDVTTTATVSPPINVCVSVPYITDSTAFNRLTLLHFEGGVLVDRTTGRNAAQKTICGSLPTLSPLVIALGPASSATPTPTATASPTATATATATVAPTATATATATPTATATATATIAPTATATATATPTATATATATPTATATVTATATATATVAPTATATATATPTATATATAAATATVAPTATATATATPTATATATATPTATATVVPTATATATASATATAAPSATATATPTATPAQALNISTRLRVETGDKVMIGGFIITGNAPKAVVLRGLGPSLVSGGLPAASLLKDPVLELRGASGALITSNDNWKESPQRSQIEGTIFQPTDDRESVILVTLPPANYTVILKGVGQTAGIGLIEIYDNNQAADSALANISTRGFVQTGNEVMIGGFILGGNNKPTRVAVRALGPSLSAFGLANVLADPTLELHNANGTTLISNDDWQSDSTSAGQLSANGLGLPDPKESGIFTSLAPGQFTAIVAGKNGGIGIALVEIYNLE